MQRCGTRGVLWVVVLTVVLVMPVAWAQAPAKGSWSGLLLLWRPWGGIPTLPGCRAVVACSISGQPWNTSLELIAIRGVHS